MPPAGAFEEERLNVQHRTSNVERRTSLKETEYPISSLEQQSRNQFCNHGTHGTHGKRLTTKHTNHTKKTIVNFLLRKNLTLDFVKNVQKKQEYDGLYYGISND
jgi:hypothetical protein